MFHLSCRESWYWKRVTAVGLPSTRQTRALYPDLLKTFLVVGMIFAHVAQIIDSTLGHVEHAVLIYINLVTFAGFMLAFGMGVGLSRRKTLQRSIWERARDPFLLFLAYCVSSFAFLELVGKQSVGGKEIVDIVTMRHLYGYSEFLASFFLLALVTSFLRGAIFAICDRTWLIVVSCFLSVTVSILNFSTPEVPMIGALVGSHLYATFPLVQNLPSLRFQRLEPR